MSMIQYETFVVECEKLIRAGKIALVARQLSALNHAQVPRQWRAPLSKLCRRSGLFTSALKLLTPIVRAPEEKKEIVPTAEESAEYAACLQINGSIGEAIRILKSIESEIIPEALLYRAWCHFTRWEYKDSIPLLDRYLRSSIPPYWKLVGAINLSAALAMVRNHERAMATIEYALNESRDLNLARIEANCLELRAQVHIQCGSYLKAQHDLDEALKILGMARVQESLFVKKWKAVLESVQSGSIELFSELKVEAKERGRWEICREADLFSLKARFNQNTFNHLVYGTAFPAYRERVAEELGVKELQSHIIMGDPSVPCLDVETGTLDGQLLFKPGSRIHQVLEVLLRDLYRPSNVGDLFSELFPDENFDVFSSPGRVHQSLFRARQSLLSSELPLAVIAERGQFSVMIQGDLSLRLPLHKSRADWYEIHYRKLVESSLDGVRLTASVMKQLLKLNESEYRRFVKWGMERAWLARSYDGSLPVYEVTDRLRPCFPRRVG